MAVTAPRPLQAAPEVLLSCYILAVQEQRGTDRKPQSNRAFGSEIWPELSAAAAGDRIRQLHQGHWPKPGRLTEIAVGLGVTIADLFSETGS